MCVLLFFKPDWLIVINFYYFFCITWRNPWCKRQLLLWKVSDICGYHNGVVGDTGIQGCDTLFVEQVSCSLSHTRPLAIFTIRLSPKETGIVQSV